MPTGIVCSKVIVLCSSVTTTIILLCRSVAGNNSHFCIVDEAPSTPVLGEFNLGKIYLGKFHRENSTYENFHQWTILPMKNSTYGKFHLWKIPPMDKSAISQKLKSKNWFIIRFSTFRIFHVNLTPFEIKNFHKCYQVG